MAKFAEISGFPNVYENFSYESPQLYADATRVVDLKGAWRDTHFRNDNPITLELACGRGEYTVALAREFPDRNFIGVDIKGARIWKGAKQALAQGLHNAAFLRTRIECIDAFFEKGEVDEIWITFPDPFPREGQANRRLTSPVFMDKYRCVLSRDGNIHLKTDNTGIFLYTLEVIAGDDNCSLLEQYDHVYNSHELSTELAIPTFYEKLHRDEGALIKYARFAIH